MSMPKPLRIKILMVVILACGAIKSFAQCKNIDADVKIVEAVNNIDGNSILVDFKNSNSNAFKVSLFVPDKKNILNSDKTEFKNLNSGKYLVVIVGKRDEDNFCPKSINVTIN